MTNFQPMEDSNEQIWEDPGQQLAADGVRPLHWASWDFHESLEPQAAQDNAYLIGNNTTTWGQDNAHPFAINTDNDIYLQPPAQNNTRLPVQYTNYVCPTCFASYKTKGDLARHQREKHSAQEYICPINRCPRGIEGEGFARNDHLVKHLVSKKHNMAKIDAAFLVRQHRKPKSKKRHEEGKAKRVV